MLTVIAQARDGVGFTSVVFPFAFSMLSGLYSPFLYSENISIKNEKNKYNAVPTTEEINNYLL